MGKKSGRIKQIIVGIILLIPGITLILGTLFIVKDPILTSYLLFMSRLVITAFITIIGLLFLFFIFINFKRGIELIFNISPKK